MTFNYNIRAVNCLGHIVLLGVVCVFIFSNISYAQDQAANWYFGFNAGINFTNNNVESLNNGALYTNEGCATISNSKGELLFYTNGVSVWDKKHELMPNGEDLLGNESSSQSAVIIPKPNSESIYYIFTVINEGNAEGLRYSEVNMSLNGGNGDITSNKNVFLIAPCTEKLSAVQHSNGVDYWLSTHLWNSDSFATFKITENGVETTPVISPLGSYHGVLGFNVIGCMKFSPNGKKIALTRWSTNSIVEIFDFNKETGMVSNGVLIDEVFGQDYLNGAYGLEFSTNSQFLYVSELNQKEYTSELHQFDLSEFTQNAVKASDVIIAKELRLISAMQLGPNGKIYISNTFSSYLSVIESPNYKGLGCDYNSRMINLNGRSAIYGLPSFVQSFFIGKIDVENLCFNDAMRFNLTTTEPIDSIEWEFGDGETSSSLNPEHIFATIGDYLVKVTFKSGSCIYNVSKGFTVYNTPIINEVSDYLICDDKDNDGFESFDLSSKTPEIMGLQSDETFELNYFESYEDAVDHVNIISGTITNKTNFQDIYFKISNKLNLVCYDISSFKLIVGIEKAGIAEDLILCGHKSNDGKEHVDLTQFDDAIYNGASKTAYQIGYYSSQEESDIGASGLNPISFETTSDNQELFARLENIETGCYTTSSFKIIVNEMSTANKPEDLFFCDDASNDGKVFFDLGSQTSIVLSGQIGNVSYHFSQEDADLGLNSLPENYENQSPSQQIFVRVESLENSECYDVTSFTIRVNKQPIIDMDNIWYLCSNETVQLYVNSIHDEYIWDSGETSSELIIDQAGDYTVTVYDVDNNSRKCGITKTVTVVDANLPTTVNIEVNDWSANSNSINIQAEGSGDFKYSLDGNIYTSSNYFDNLDAGDYTVYIRNESDCTVYTKEIYLLNYPKYFTPNNDGYHDYWRIEFAESEPNLEIYIFDRYGKLIIQLNPYSKGWDGTLNGYPLATSDYWFVIDRPSKNKRYQGHFTLKR